MSSQKVFNLSKEEDVAAALRILFESESENEEGIQDSDEEDGVISDFQDKIEDEQLQNPYSSIDQTAADSFDSDSDSLLQEEPGEGDKLKIVQVPTKLRGKNGFRWSGKKGKLHRLPQRNLVVHLPGNKNEAKNIISGLEAWELCFTKENLDCITQHTNQEMARQRLKYKSDRLTENDAVEDAVTSVRPSYTRNTNPIELKALFGLLYYAGVMKMHGVFTKELFDKDSGIPIFRATMCEARFRYLINCLRFDNKETRPFRKQTDRLAAFREVFERSLKKMQQLYVPSEYTTIDEQLVSFRGRCAFKMYIQSKPDKYGIKIVMSCDAKTFYVIDAEVYTGKGSTPDNIPVAHYYCDKLTSSFQNTNRNLTMDNWFTSVSTSKFLLEKKITTVGTLRKNKKEIPPSFLEVKTREKNSAIFAFSDPLTLLSYCPPKNKKKIVLLLSTMHEKGDDPDSTTLPQMIEFYNQTKGGVDTLDQLCHTYSCSRKTRRWPLCLFYNLLNIVGVNSMILLAGSDAPAKEVMKNRRSFLKALAMDLVKPHMLSRLGVPTLPRELRETICRFQMVTYEEVATSKPKPSAGRCAFCERSRDRKSRIKCAMCRKFICLEHQKKVCPNCS